MKNWLPTNKWVVASIATAGTIAGMIWVGDGINTDEEKLVVISLVVQRLAAYWARNEPEAATVTDTGREARGRFQRKRPIAGEPGVTEPRNLVSS